MQWFSRKRSKPTPIAALPAHFAKRRALYAGLLVLAVFAVHPLVIGPLGYQNITAFKGNSFRIILGVSLGLVFLAWLRILMLGHTPRPRALADGLNNLRPFEWALLAYWAVILLSAATSDDLHTAFFGASLRNEGFWYQSGYILAFLMVSRYYKPRPRDLMVLCAAAALVALYAIPQYYGHDFLGFFPEKRGPVPHYDQLIHSSTMSNVNVASTYYCLALCASAAMFCLHPGRMKWGFLASALVVFYALLMGDTESGYLGLLLALVLCFPFVAKDKKAAARLLLLLAGFAMLAWAFGFAWEAYYYEAPLPLAALHPYWPVIAGLLAAVAAALYFLPLPKLPSALWRGGWLALMAAVAITGAISLPAIAKKTGNQTLSQAAAILRGEVQDEFGSGRIGAWKEALSLVPEHPILGHGPDNFGRIYMQRFLKTDAQGNVIDLPFDKAHNEYLQTLVDSGILGLTALLAFYGLLLWAVRKRLHSPMAIAMAVALVCFLGQAFFNFSTPFAHPVAWTCWGLLGAVLRPGEAIEGRRGPPAA